MQVIVTYRNFHDINREELFPEVFQVRQNETAEEALERVWSDHYNNAICEEEFGDALIHESCWHEEDMALITWADGDTKEFYIVEVEV